MEAIAGEIRPGRPWPLGAQWDGEGVNFALFSAHAERVRLCLFEAGEVREIEVVERTDDIWHVYVAGAAPGLCYAYRVDGSRAPGHRCDPSKHLLDPYAREVAGEFSYAEGGNGLRACVVNDGEAAFDWGEDAPPLTPLADSVLYEIHVKGATRLHLEVPEALRGTYAGFSSAPFIAHLQKLGVTAVKLLPVHGFLDEARLAASGRTNYWGYNTLSFFAPERRYATARPGVSPRDEFRSMVRSLHAAGIEVILDVVYNHTAESDQTGPTISFRGIDNLNYYKVVAGHPDTYLNFSGCGNTLDLAHPRVLQLVMDSLRYWVREMHVDGFRFDLATALTRSSGFLAAVRQDPLLAHVKLIAEPWDLGPEGYRLGRFPPGWSEWNDRYRDEVRAWWLTGEAGPGALAHRLAGSSGVFERSGRAPQAGVNFITAHDGFTLRDLVSYRFKHNEANGEDNRDGHDHNVSTNCGVEGDTADPIVLRRRALLQRALLATLFVSRGVPMLQGGDEIGRSQAGNNNAYCQDSPLTWLDWNRADAALLDFTAGMIALRARFAQLRSRRWLTGKASTAGGERDVVWLNAAGDEMREADWQNANALVLGYLLAAEANDPARERLLVWINRGTSAIDLKLPTGLWQQCCDSSADSPFAGRQRFGSTRVEALSVLILSQPASSERTAEP